MKHISIAYLLILFLVGAITFRLSAAPGNDECLNCHEALDGKVQTPAIAFKNDVHHAAGITCAGCHGGNSSVSDMEEGMDKKKGYTGIPSTKERYVLCVKCHAEKKAMQSFGYRGSTEQFEKLKSSVHFKNSYNDQGPIADCITCHGAHGILGAKNPQSRVHPTKIVQLCGNCHSDPSYMQKYNPGLPVDQVMKYRTSIHGVKNAKGDTRTAQCVSCHGNHEIYSVKDPRSAVYNLNIAKTCSHCHSDTVLMAQYNIPANQYKKYQKSVHGIALLEKGDAAAPSCNGCHGNHAAILPGAESVSKVCGTCHAFNMELFEQGPHKTAFNIKKIPECESCHGNHGIEPVTDEFLGTSSRSFCISCHQAGDNGYKTAAEMKQLLDTLTASKKNADQYLDIAERLGMDVTDEKYALKNMKQLLIKVRTSVHVASLGKFKEEIAPGFEIVKDAETHGRKSIENYYFRRKGLMVSTVIVSILVGLLYLKLKRIEKEDRA
ncbi:MAG: cytochrome c3 family protein [Ignavibacteriales bacterium]|nr:cytochrome c3 family protein [Ignavibacteriales bacterium]